MIIKTRCVILCIWILLILTLPVQDYRVKSVELQYLGEFFRGDVIKITGRLLVIDNNTEIPIFNAVIELFANLSDGKTLFLGSNKTNVDGLFLFSIRIDHRFPTGEVIFTAYYPGDALLGYDSVRMYYRAIIKHQSLNNLDYEIGLFIGILLLIMMTLGTIMVTLRISRHEQKAETTAVWIETLDNMITRASKKDFGFVLLSGSLLDSLCKRFGKIPRLDMTIQEKLMLIREHLSENGFNILKNVVSLYEIQLFGGPYARNILMTTLDYALWAHLLKVLREELGYKQGR
ncbi:MAG: hypothetical protein QXH55_03005 [Candidatus Korarchaeota archaeon]|nr:hypothetical protein [Thermoproteota archaeon]MCR8463165.1 hypothetical protein [Thermoproteota archaeon]MCR8470497.1 hypothetical protein [Thermoproteota archaeon]MCR8471856.1 hypothetical protein [Thermoproteota archaeon]MCR8472832.1 hypothetical protein [Thermoproteota archaeon]